MREKGGEGKYSGTFMEYWIEKLIYYDLPFYYFTAAYSIFLIFVILLMFIFPPLKKRR